MRYNEQVNLVTDYLLGMHIDTDKETDGMICKSDSEYNMFNSLLGKTLTLIDASISDKEQRKAMKAILKDQFYKEQRIYSGVVYNYLGGDNEEKGTSVDFEG